MRLIPLTDFFYIHQYTTSLAMVVACCLRED